jgi:hypothetical protein
MFCPQCGSNQSDEVKFCKACGANLHSVRQAVAAREAEEKFDWSKTWVAEMLLSESERKKRGQEVERESGVTPEVKRYNEIKSGVITACVGIGVTVFLYVFMQGLILSGQVPPHEAEIVRRLWAVGVIPFMVGIGLLINGLFVSKRLVEAAKREARPAPEVGAAAERPGLRPADTAEFIPADYSVTEGTTKHLSSPRPKPPARDT